ncbi:YdcF family protein [Nesterenkonia massiliensis]|uniref:YdcF family protein n=1 Tax=Nesterenkonia massiliensis TaxID=1232429 RepID=UPI0003FBE7C1|nr:YdcF family protein [Nesterenkonia massiliensis]
MLHWILILLLISGTLIAATGLFRFIRDGRRLAALAATAAGAGTALLAAGLIELQQGQVGVFLFVSIGLLVALALGNLLGYPLLTLFLLWSGVTVLRRESRSLGNALALAAGLFMLVLPWTLQLLEPAETVQDNAGYMIRYGAHTAAVMLVAYIAFSFAAVLAASWLYRLRRTRFTPAAIIILGSGLVNGAVPPLLKKRLERGLQAHAEYDGAPLLIPTGGQGPDEPVAEGEAMAQYLLEQGVPAQKIRAETEAKNTEQNLQFSRRLLSDPADPVLVVTSSYHAYRAALLTQRMGMQARAIGAKTAWYFLPSALLREFIGVLRDNARLHALAALLIIALAAAAATVLVPAMTPPP